MRKVKNEDFKYQRLSQEEQKQRGILGRLVGVCADFINPTRNGRKYDEQLWENVFKDPIMKEKIDNHICFGELGHPEDREEVDMDKIAICLAEQPVKGTDGKLHAVFDILDTPNGRILKTLCDYGSNIGISSRGTGDLYTDYDGNEAVDPETYHCECWDAVLIPAVPEARLQYVTESLDTKKYNKTLRQKLTEELDKASEEDKKIMNETLKNLDIKLNEKLVKPSEEDLKPIEDRLAELGLEIERKGETLFGNVHYQLRKELDHKVTKDDLGPIFDALCDLETPEMPTVCNVGVHRDGDNIVSASLDVLERQVNEELQDTDGWGDEIPQRLEQTFRNLEDMMYEVRNARRGSYAINGDEVEDLVTELRDLANALEMDADDLEFDQDGLNEGAKIKKESVSENGCSDKEDQVVEDDAGISGEDLMKELQEALSRNGELEKDNLSLQEKLSVCNAKEIRLNEELNKYKKVSSSLSGTARKVKSLEEEVEKLNNQIDYKNKLIESKNERLNKLVTFKKENITKLTESDSKISDLENQIKVLKESVDKSDKKLSDTVTLVKKYQRALKESRDRYISAKADACGLSVDSVKAQLKESYNYKDIDSVCDKLVEQKVNMSKLPFRLNENTQFKVKTSQNEYIRGNRSSDDDVSDYLLSMIK